MTAGRRLGRSLLVLALAALAVLLGVRSWRAKDRGAVHRGSVVAQSHGCFACHGPGGSHGMANPGHGLGDVPTWSGGLITMYADDEGEIREWIEDGMPKRLRADPQQMKLRQGAAIAMPAFRGAVSDGEVQALVAYVKAVSDFEKPTDAKAEEGRQVATKFGCFNCHGPQGRGAVDNPGSFKGYVPGWDGPDYAELAQTDAEAREWILDGCARRLKDNRIARFFLDRQKVSMPAYRPHLSAAEVDGLLAYIHWLRQHPY
jgi:mono/diheme cytochrome c family protein